MDGILSFNDEVKLGNREFHVQTEYYDVGNEVVSLIFEGGKVIKRITVPLREGKDINDEIRKVHKAVILRLLGSRGRELKQVKLKGVLDIFKSVVSKVQQLDGFLGAFVYDMNKDVVITLKKEQSKFDKNLKIFRSFLESIAGMDTPIAFLETDDSYFFGFKRDNEAVFVLEFEKRVSPDKVKRFLLEAFGEEKKMGKALKALVVDDVLFTRLVMEEALKMLENEDFSFTEIEQAESYEEAIEKISEKSFDVVITDLRLGDGVGVDIAKHIKEKFPSTKVIALTMYPEDYEKNKEIFDGFVRKPISPEELKEKLKAVISS